MLKKIIISLKRIPFLKKIVKFFYQKIGLLISNKKSIPNTIKRVSNKNEEALFGYYDKTPWSRDNSKFIYLRTKNANKYPAGKDEAQIILKNFNTNEELVVDSTKTWNSQQGAMLQWLGPDFNSKIIFNNFYNGKYVANIINLENMKKNILDHPIYTIDSKGENCFWLDFSRLNTLRPGYGYSNIIDNSKGTKLPSGPAIFWANLKTHTSDYLITYEDLYNIMPQDDNFKKSFHKVNHIMSNPSGNAIIFLHRWIYKGNKSDRLLAYFLDSKELKVILDEGMVSHCNWKNDSVIITFARTLKQGDRYYEININTGEVKLLDKLPKQDGHPSFSPNGKYIIMDTYPSLMRKQKIFLYKIETGELNEIASVYSNGRYMNNTRCDLHPRWNWNSKEICFDSNLDKHRGVYLLKIPEEYL